MQSKVQVMSLTLTSNNYQKQFTALRTAHYLLYSELSGEDATGANVAIGNKINM